MFPRCSPGSIRSSTWSQGRRWGWPRCIFSASVNPDPSDQTRMKHVTPRPRMAALYGLLAIALAVIGYALRPWGLILIWPAASLSVIAAAYLWFGPYVFHKRGGRLHPVT